VSGHEFTHAVQFQWWAVSLVNAVPFGGLLEITSNPALSSLPMIATPIGGLDKEYAHGIVDHAKEYVNGQVHTNGWKTSGAS
jgi:hypothetical protein